jgi:hypothetical protein
MDDIGEIRTRLLLSKLEAKLAMLQIEAAALSKEIRSPLTSARRRDEATDRRDAALAESSAIIRTYPDSARFPGSRSATCQKNDRLE